MLEVHKGSRWLAAGQDIDVLGVYYGAFGEPPEPPVQPFAVLLTIGPAGWGTGLGALCGGGISVEDLRRLGAENPEGPRDRYIADPPKPPVCFCGPHNLFGLVGTTQHNLSRALRRGIRFKVGCSRKCRFTARILLTRGRRTVTAAVAGIRLNRGESRTLTVRFTREARKRLAKQRRVELTLRTTFRAGSATARRDRPLVLTARRRR